MSNNKTYDYITERLIEKIRSGGSLPWHKPWKSAANAVSKKEYRGINAFMLGTSQHASRFWLTYKQATDLGGSVRKGEKSEMVVYFTILEKRDKDGNTIVDELGRKCGIPFLRYSNVFNVDQTEGIKIDEKLEATYTDSDCSKAETIVKNAIDAKRVPIIEHVGSRACYSPDLDIVRMPAKTSFDNNSSYYHTLFHELTHSTGHASRLARDFGKRFGNEPYAKEELIAELGASFLSNDAGILGSITFDNSAAYLENWVSVLKRDTKLIVSASSAAQRAANYIQNKS